MLTLTRLKETWDYDATTHTWTNRLTGHVSTKGKQLRIDTVLYPKSRLAHLYVTGTWPELQHGKRPRRKPAQRHVDRAGGKVGVYRTPAGRYEARICVDSRQIMLGTFDTEDDAVVVRKYAEKLVYE